MALKRPAIVDDRWFDAYSPNRELGGNMLVSDDTPLMADTSVWCRVRLPRDIIAVLEDVSPASDPDFGPLVMIYTDVMGEFTVFGTIEEVSACLL